MIARARIHAAHCHCEACSDDPALRARNERISARVRAAADRPALSDALTGFTLAALGCAVFVSTFVSR